MTGIREELVRAMKIAGYAERSVKLYATCLGVVFRHFGRSPLEAGRREIEGFFLGLRESGRSDSTVHIYYEALKYFFSLHGQRESLPDMRFRPRRRRLPVVLAQSEIARLFQSCESLRLKTILAVIYSSGLRVSEATGLRLADVDFVGMRICIRKGKNGKDRHTILARSATRLLRTYINIYKPCDYLFYRARDIALPVPSGSVQCAFRRLSRSCGFPRDFHVHCLRHCFATHLLENGTDVFLIMKLLGHANIQATMVYLHVQDLGKFNIESPMDRLPQLGPPDGAMAQDGQKSLW